MSIITDIVLTRQELVFYNNILTHEVNENTNATVSSVFQYLQNPHASLDLEEDETQFITAMPNEEIGKREWSNIVQSKLLAYVHKNNTSLSGAKATELRALAMDLRNNAEESLCFFHKIAAKIDQFIMKFTGKTTYNTGKIGAYLFASQLLKQAIEVPGSQAIFNPFYSHKISF